MERPVPDRRALLAGEVVLPAARVAGAVQPEGNVRAEEPADPPAAPVTVLRLPGGAEASVVLGESGEAAEFPSAFLLRQDRKANHAQGPRHEEDSAHPFRSLIR